VIAYLDASVLLRALLRQPAPLREWRWLTGAVTSELTLVECHRTIDRRLHAARITSAQADEMKSVLKLVFDQLTILDLSDEVLHLAGAPLPKPLGTLDAIHLATAMLRRDAEPSMTHFATHDNELAAAARALNFPTLGA